MTRCMSISEVRSRSPRSLFPLRSHRIRSSSRIVPLHTPVGVARMRPSSVRTVTFPSLAAIQPFSNTRRPTLMMSSRCCCSVLGIPTLGFSPSVALLIVAGCSGSSGFDFAGRRRGGRLALDLLLGPPAIPLFAGPEAGEIAAAGGAAIGSGAEPQQDHGPLRRAIILLAPGGQILA